MTEEILNIVQALKIVYLAGFSFLYGWGGVSGKWKRRYVGPAYLTGGVVLFSLVQSSFSWFYLGYFFLLMGALSIGYGENSALRKLFKHKSIVRLVAGFALAFASIPIAIVTGQWLMFGLHILLCCSVSVVMGVGNPISARGEEVIIATTCGFLPLYFIG
jgi:hypothetical protein